MLLRMQQTELVWRNTKTEICNFHTRSKIPGMKTVNGSYTVYLDNYTVVNNVTSSFRIVTSRLLVRVLTSLRQKDTDRIECLAYTVAQTTLKTLSSSIINQLVSIHL